MNLLLDTHTFIWWSDARLMSQLSPAALAACQDAQNTLTLSIVSIWEIQIKVQIGKLSLPAPLSVIVETQRTRNKLVTLPVIPNHIYQINALPMHHKDPFDRLMIAQAIYEKMTIVTTDAHFLDYTVSTLW